MTVWASTQKAHDLLQSLNACSTSTTIGCGSRRPTSAAASAPSSASIPRTSRWWRRRSSSAARSNGSRTGASISPMRRRSATSTGRSTSRSTAHGKVLGIRGRLLHDLGAYALQDVNLPYNSASMLSGPYMVPALDMDVMVAATNKTPVSSVRGAGYPQAAFAMERLMDRVARELKLDRAEVRRRNLIPAEKDALHEAAQGALRRQHAIRQRRLSGLPGEGAHRPPAGTIFRAGRQAARARRAATSASAWRMASRAPGAGRSSPAWCGSRRPGASRSSPAPPRWGRGSRPRWRRSARASWGCAPKISTSCPATPRRSRSGSAASPAGRP